jgi:nucleotide-binding universal stress UspA family protein
MKTIVVPFEFDNTSKNAAKYAMEIAGLAGAQVLLYHSFMPVNAPELPVMYDYVSELQNQYSLLMEEYVCKLRRKYPGRQVSWKVQPAFLLEGIREYIREHRPWLTVAGVNKKSFFPDSVLGSTSLQLFHHTQTPVLAVPARAKFTSLKKILIASDFSSLERRDFASVESIAALFDSEIAVLGLFRSKVHPGEVKEARVIVGKAFRNLLHRVTARVGDNVSSIIREALRLEQANLLVMEPSGRNLFEVLNQKSQSENVLGTSETIPMLLLPEKTGEVRHLVSPRRVANF